MRLFLLFNLVSLALLNSSSLSAQCDAYKVQVSTTGFACESGRGKICFYNHVDWNAPDGDNSCGEYSRLEILFPAADFIVIDQGDFVNIDPLNPVTTTWRNDSLSLASVGVSSFCIFGVVQNPGVEIEYRIIDPDQPLGANNPITTGTLTPDGLTTIGAPNTRTMLSEAIEQQQLLDVTDASTTSQRIAIEGTLVIDLPDYRFTNSGQRSEIVMRENAAIEVLPGNRLDLHDTDVYGCDGKWDAIRMLGPSARVELSGSDVSGAITAFDLYSGSALRTINSTFRDNEVVINAAKSITGDSATAIDIEIIGNSWINNRFANNSEAAIRVRQGVGDINLVSTSTQFSNNNQALDCTGGDILLFENYFTNNGNGIVLSDNVDRDNVAIVSSCLFNRQNSFDIAVENRSSLVIDDCEFSGALVAIRNNTKPGDFFRIEDCLEISSERSAVWNINDNCRGEVVNNFSIESNTHDVMSLHGRAGRSSVSIEQNTQIAALASGNGSAIRLNDMTATRIINNLQILGATSGLAVDGGSENIIVFNPDINGNQSGIHLESSPMAHLDCNTMYGDRGLEVINDNSGATIRTQNLIGSELGLAYGSPSNSFANTGDQVNQGNLFDMSSPSTPQAINYSNPQIADKNQYLLRDDAIQGESKYPYNQASISDWFQPEGGVDASCLLDTMSYDRQVALRNAIDSGKDILHIVDTLFSCEVVFDVEYNLAKNLIEYSELSETGLTDDDLVVMSTLAEKESFQLASLVHQVDQAVTLPQDVQVDVDQLNQRVVEVTNTVHEVLSDVPTPRNTTTIDSSQLSVLKQSMQNSQLLLDSMETVKQSYRALSLQELLDLKEALEAVTTSCPSATYLKDMVLLDIKARTDSLTEQDLAYIAMIADLCSRQYGKGVYRARSLRAAFDDTAFVHHDDCPNLVETTEVIVSETKFTLYPNPADDQITIEWKGDDIEPSAGAQWMITNALGRTLLVQPIQPQTLQTLDVSTLPSGIYHLSETTGSLGSTSFIKID